MRIGRLAALLIVPALAAISATPATASDGVVNLYARLNGHNEIGPTFATGGGDRDGAGVAHVKVLATKVCWSYRTQRIGTPVAAHIHAGVAGSNGPVVVPLAAGSGCVDISRDLARSIKAHPGRYYLNVHTAAFPGGAIRGQLRGVPARVMRTN
jgi:hypothetical protein